MKPKNPSNYEIGGITPADAEKQMPRAAPAEKDALVKKESAGADLKSQSPNNPEASADLSKKIPFTEQEKEQLIAEIISLRPYIRSYVQSNLAKMFPTVIDEVTDEILQKTVLELEQLRNKEALVPWMESIKRRKVIDFIRENKNRLLFQAIRRERNPDYKNSLVEELSNRNNKNSLEEEFSDGSDIERDVVTKERNEIIWKSVNRLELKYKIPILLFYYENFSVEQIMKTLGLSEGTVKIRLHRGRENLLRMIKIKDLKK